MRNVIYAGIIGFVVGITVGVYGIAPDSEVIVGGAKKKETFRESDVKEVAASAKRKQGTIIGTGNVKSPYYAAGAGTCRFLNRGTEKHGITCSTERICFQHQKYPPSGRAWQTNHGCSPVTVAEPRLRR